VLELFSDLITNYGYIIIVITIFLECAGIPIPGETALTIAAAFAGAGKLDIYWIAVIGSIAAILGDSAGYWIGRRYGRKVIDRYGKWILSKERVERLERFFARHGPKAVFIGRHFSIIRSYSAMFAGMCRMPYATFTLYNALGGITWAITYSLLGYMLGLNFELIERTLKTIGWALTLPLATIFTVMLGWRWILKKEAVVLKKGAAFAKELLYSSFYRRYSWYINWFLRHWKADYYMIIHNAAGFLLCCAILYTLSEFVYQGITIGKSHHLDRYVLHLFQQGATPLATSIFEGIAYLATASIALFGIFIPVVYGLRKAWLYMSMWIVSFCGSQALIILFKLLIARPRPVIDHVFIAPYSFSFPSGHALASLTVYGMLAYFLIIGHGTWLFKTGIITTGIIIISLISFSRLYLGVTFISDVICGLAGGFAWLATCISATELYRYRKVGDRRKVKRKAEKKQNDSKLHVPVGSL